LPVARDACVRSREAAGQAYRLQIKEVGEKLRGMMPWIKGNALVDKSKS
tara:strand:+ start:1783 stop:1929 length:147 start_codon:yes stop_codon:yes gene_type:complete